MPNLSNFFSWISRIGTPRIGLERVALEETEYKGEAFLPSPQLREKLSL